MGVLDSITDNEVLENKTTSYANDNTDVLATDMKEPEEHGTAMEAFGYAAVRENFMLDWVRSGMIDGGGENITVDNPYQYLKETQDEETLELLKPHISNGLFHGVETEEEILNKIAEIEQESEWLKTMEAHPWATVAGGVGTAFLDPTTYIPVYGQASKLSKGVKIANFMLQTTALTGLTELSLQQSQELRTIQESLLNVGAGAAVSGTLGFLLTKSHGLDLTHLPDDLKVRAPAEFHGGGLSADVVDDSLHATPQVGLKADWAASKNPLKRGAHKIGTTVTKATLTGRAMNRLTGEARNVMGKIMDFGGTLTKNDEAYQGRGMSAEAIKNVYMTEKNRLFHAGTFLLIRASERLAGLKAPKLSPEDFNLASHRDLHDAWTPEVEKTFRDKYGDEGLEVIKQHTGQYKQEIQKLNNFFGERMTELGLLRNEDKIVELNTQISDLKKNIKAQQKATQDQKLQAAKDGNREDHDIIKGMMDDLNEQVKALEGKLKAEEGKPPNLGDDYGSAQLWDPETILKHREAFKDFLYDVMGSNPDEKWLSEYYGIDKQGLADIQATNPDHYKDIIRDWAGDEFHFEATRLENKIDDAEWKLEQTRLDLLEAAKAKQWINKDDPIPSASKLYQLVTSRLNRIAKNPDSVTDDDLIRLSELASEYSLKATAVKGFRKNAKELVKDANAKRNTAARSLKGLKKALKNHNKKGGIEEVAEEIIENITNRGTPPKLEDVTIEGGRLRERRLTLTREQKIRAYEKFDDGYSFLRTDLPNVLDNQYNELSGQLAFREAFGIHDGGRYGSIKEVIRTVEDAYRAKMEGADKATYAALQDDLEGFHKDFNGAYLRLLDKVDTGDWHPVVKYLSKKFRTLNYLRYGPAFLIPSLNEMANVMLRHNVVSGFKDIGLKEIWRTAKGLDVHGDEIKEFLSSIEYGLHSTALSHRVGDDDLFFQGGIGQRGSRLRNITSKIDAGSDVAMTKVSQWSGLDVWNRFWKTFGGLMTANNIRRAVMDYSSLSHVKKRQLASIGIGEAEVDRLKIAIEKYGTTSPDGKFEFNLEQWDYKDQRLFKVAMDREARTTNVTPGIGDTPLIMDGTMGKLWLQFQTFGFATVNRYLVPLSQRLSEGELRAAASVVTLLSVTAFSVALRDRIKGNDPMERYEEGKLAQTTTELIDRSGLLAYLAPYGAATSSMLGLGTSSRFEGRDTFEALAGINYGLFDDVTTATAKTSKYIQGDEDGEAVINAVTNVLPYNLAFKALLNFTD